MADLATFLLIAAVALAGGVAIGTLVAPAVTRWTDRESGDDAGHAPDEEPGA